MLKRVGLLYRESGGYWLLPAQRFFSRRAQSMSLWGLQGLTIGLDSFLRERFGRESQRRKIKTCCLISRSSFCKFLSGEPASWIRTRMHGLICENCVLISRLGYPMDRIRVTCGYEQVRQNLRSKVKTCNF